MQRQLLIGIGIAAVFWQVSTASDGTLSVKSGAKIGQGSSITSFIVDLITDLSKNFVEKMPPVRKMDDINGKKIVASEQNKNTVVKQAVHFNNIADPLLLERKQLTPGTAVLNTCNPCKPPERTPNGPGLICVQAHNGCKPAEGVCSITCGLNVCGICDYTYACVPEINIVAGAPMSIYHTGCYAHFCQICIVVFAIAIVFNQ